MQPTSQVNLKLLHNPARLAHLMDSLDEIHTAASEGTLGEIAAVSEADLRGWLLEIIYLAEETLVEMDAQQEEREPAALALVRKSS